MKNIKFLAIILCAVLTLSLVACGSEPEPQLAAEVVALQGDYMIDAADYGMPILIYINVDDKGNFKLSNGLDYATDKGHGTISYKDGTFMFIYSDSTIDAPKTATFTSVNNNLVFSTRVPYGTSGISSEATNPVTAKTLANRELLGKYFGSHKTSGMMAVTYNYYIELKAGCEYAIRSEFIMSMGGATELYYYLEEGTFNIEGTALTLYPVDISSNMAEPSKYQGDPIVGTIENKIINISVQPSSMAKTRYDATLTFGTMAEYAGTYYGYYNKNMGGTQLTVLGILVLDPFGGYTFSIKDMIGEDEYTESGTYTVDGATYMVTPKTANGADVTVDAIACTVENYILNGKFPVSSMAPMRGTFNFFNSMIIGGFTYTDATCSAELTTSAIGSAYTLKVKNANGDEILNSVGTISTSGGMGMTYLVLTDANGDSYQFLVSDSGINGNIEIGATTYGVAFK